MDITKEKLEELALECKSKSDFCKKLNINPNGVGYKKINTLFEKFGLKFEFKKSKNHFVKYETIIKKCPICKNEFETKKGSKKEKMTCSHSCSNTFFRSKVNHPNWKDETYRTTCFFYHKHECVVCKENLLLDVHHLDGNKKNNKPENLIPLCATHHNYWHSRYRYLVEDVVLEYVKNFKQDMG